MSKKKNKKVNGGHEQKKSEANQQIPENNNSYNKKGEEEEEVEEQGGGKKESNGGGNAVVLKIDLHCDCEGCASKIVKIVRGFQGAEAVKVDGGSGKITVTGKVDPVKLREKLEEKTHKKVELLSPVHKKDKENSKSKNDGVEEVKEGKKKDSKDKKPKDKNNTKKDEKNSKELPVTTAVLKVALHCEGCIHKIHKIVTKTKGYEEMKLDAQKDLVTVKGAMDMKDLAETLKKHLKRDVEIVPPKKDDKKEKGGGGGGSGGGGGGEGKGAGGGDGGEKSGGSAMQQPQVQFDPYGYGYPSPSPIVYGGPAYGYGYPSPSPIVYGGPAYVGDPYQFHYPPHAPQMFSDENPNACTIM